MDASSSNISDFDSVFSLGLKLYKMGQNNDAILALRRATELENSRGEAFVALGELYDKLGQTEKAILTYKKGIKAHPQFVDNYFDLAVLYGRQISTIRQNLMAYPIGYLAETQEKTHEYFLKAAYLNDAESKKILQKESITANTKEEIIFELIKIGNQRMDRKNFREARSIFSFVVQNRDDDQALKVLAICNLNIGQDYDEDMDYKKAYSWYTEAQVLMTRLYDKDNTREDYKDLLGIILLTIGNLFGSWDKHDKAIEYLEKSKSLIANKHELYKFLGQEYYFNEQLNQAKQYLSEYAMSNNRSLDELLEESKLLHYHKYLDKLNILAGNSGHSQKEIDFLNKAIQMYPNKQDAYYYLGICYRYMNEIQRALKVYNKALEVDLEGEYSSEIRREIMELKSL